MTRWATPRGMTVEGMYLELTRPARREYDPDGGDGTYLLVREPGGRTVRFVTGQRPGRRTEADALAEVDAVLRAYAGEGVCELRTICRRAER